MVTGIPANKEILDSEMAFSLRVRSDKAKAANDAKQALLLDIPCKSADGTPVSTGEIAFTTGNYDDYYIELIDETYGHEFVIDNLYLDKR